MSILMQKHRQIALFLLGRTPPATGLLTQAEVWALFVAQPARAILTM
jgi:hypothetical protein